MKKVAILTVMVGFLLFARTEIASADQALDCYEVGYIEETRQHVISCDWEHPDDCANDEPAYEACEYLCWIHGPNPLVDYSGTGGDPCNTFYCRCQQDLD